MESFVVKGKKRESTGTRGAWKLRREGWVPANLYGHGKANAHFQVREDEISRLIRDGHHMLTFEVEGISGSGILREIQYDDISGRVIHVDFARVSLDEVIETNVPLVLEGTAKGVGSGGILDVPHHDVHIRGKARELPESIAVDISDLGLGEAIRAKDLTLPTGIELLYDAEEPIVLCNMPKSTEEPSDEGEATEPEVIGKKPEDEE